jgi:uncharacterized protein YegP (UPF0339 family)
MSDQIRDSTNKGQAMNGYYELKSTSAGKWMFNLKAGNHQVILTSQSYDAGQGAMDGIESVRKNGASTASFEKKVASSGDFFFVLKSSNGQVIGTSEMYKSEAARDNGIASVVENSPSTKVVKV